WGVQAGPPAISVSRRRIEGCPSKPSSRRDLQALPSNSQHSRVRGRMIAMAEELWQTLLRFHREVVKPEMQEIVDVRIDTLRDDMNSHFDAIYKRLDRIESELTAVKAGLRRLEERIEAAALRSELEELRNRSAAIEQRLAALETRN